jgi:hypothetical protein
VGLSIVIVLIAGFAILPIESVRLGYRLAPIATVGALR